MRCDPRCSRSRAVVVYSGLTHAYFLDSEGEAIAARFDDTLQYYWLSERAYRQLGERLNPDLFSAVMTQKELEQIIERERQDR